MFDNAVVTNVGKQLLAQYVQGATLVFAQAKAGTGTVSVASLMAQTALVDEKQTLSIVKKEVVTGGVRLGIQLTSYGVTTGYTLNQYGVYANVGGDNVLLAIVQDETGIAIPAFSDNPDFVVTFDLTVLMDNTGTFTVIIDTSAFVTHADFQLLKNAFEDLCLFVDSEGYIVHTIEIEEE